MGYTSELILPSGSSLDIDIGEREVRQFKTCEYCRRVYRANSIYCEDGCGAALPRYVTHGARVLTSSTPNLAEIVRRSVGLE
jgi:hypothetical protein